MKTSTIVTLTTFSLFTAEALCHTTIGYNKGKPKDEKKIIYIPPIYDFGKVVLVVATFSILNGIVINYLTKK